MKVGVSSGYSDIDVSEIKNMVERLLDIFESFDEKSFSSMTEIVREIKEQMKNTKESNLLNEISNLTPDFIYFDSINLLKDRILIDEYLIDKGKYQTFSNLFQLAGLNIENIKKIENPYHRKREFRNASAIITGLITNSWNQENVEVNIDIDGNQILVLIEDDVGAQADPPSKRSDGFQWYLSFYINFMAGIKRKTRSNAVLLLDNLGWILHPSGQKDLLNTLEKIAEIDQIIFATHSPFLIDKNRLDRIRIVERRSQGEGTKIYEKFHDSIYDSLQVIRATIGANISDSLFGHKNNIIVEGYSDKLYLETMANYLKNKKRETINLSKVMINGAGGVDKIVYFLGWHKAEGYNVIGVLDNDDGGRGAITNIKNSNSQIDIENDIVRLDEIDNEFKDRSIEIEDLIDAELFHEAVNRVYKEIFKVRSAKMKIKLDELPKRGLRTKKYGKFFKKSNLGGFDKIRVAKEIKKMIEQGKTTENELGDTMDNFEKLFSKVKEKFEKKGVEL